MRTPGEHLLGSARSFRALLGVVALIASSCATGLGPQAVRSERPDYNQQIVRSGDAEMLLNLVRLRYNDTPLFSSSVPSSQPMDTMRRSTLPVPFRARAPAPRHWGRA
jgi:hypothetical protein